MKFQEDRFVQEKKHEQSHPSLLQGMLFLNMDLISFFFGDFKAMNRRCFSERDSALMRYESEY